MSKKGNGGSLATSPPAKPPLPDDVAAQVAAKLAEKRAANAERARHPHTAAAVQEQAPDVVEFAHNGLAELKDGPLGHGLYVFVPADDEAREAWIPTKAPAKSGKLKGQRARILAIASDGWGMCKIGPDLRFSMTVMLPGAAD